MTSEYPSTRKKAAPSRRPCSKRASAARRARGTTVSTSAGAFAGATSYRSHLPSRRAPGSRGGGHARAGAAAAARAASPDAMSTPGANPALLHQIAKPLLCFAATNEAVQSEPRGAKLCPHEGGFE